MDLQVIIANSPEGCRERKTERGTMWYRQYKNSTRPHSIIFRCLCGEAAEANTKRTEEAHRVCKVNVESVINSSKLQNDPLGVYELALPEFRFHESTVEMFILWWRYAQLKILDGRLICSTIEVLQI